MLPVGMASHSFSHVFVRVGKKERPISNEMQIGRCIYDCFIESSDR